MGGDAYDNIYNQGSNPLQPREHTRVFPPFLQKLGETRSAAATYFPIMPTEAW